MSISISKIALVGIGRVSKRHLEALEANKDILCLEYVCDVIPERAGKAASETGAKAIYDFTQIQGVDFISFATPSGLHPEHVKLAAEKCDIPYIICEKPVALTVRELIDMYKFVKAKGKTILPVYQNRYNPLVTFIKDLVQSGKLGKIHQFAVNVYWNRNDEYFQVDWHGTKDLDGGVLYTQASHYVDMLHYLFGLPEAYSGFGGSLRGLDTFDSISASLKFRNGAVGTLNATVSVYRQNYMTEFTIIGQKGTVRLTGTNLNEIEFWDVEGMNKPDMDFKIDHQYGKGHDLMYRYAAEKKFDMFPSYEDVLSGITLMEKLSY